MASLRAVISRASAEGTNAINGKSADKVKKSGCVCTVFMLLLLFGMPLEYFWQINGPVFYRTP